MNSLPERTADTMSEAIAISSPSGRMSKQERGAATKRLGRALFGDYEPTAPQETEAENLARNIAQIEGLLARGMKPKGYKKALATWKTRLAEIEAE